MCYFKAHIIIKTKILHLHYIYKISKSVIGLQNSKFMFYI